MPGLDQADYTDCMNETLNERWCCLEALTIDFSKQRIHLILEETNQLLLVLLRMIRRAGLTEEVLDNLSGNRKMSLKRFLQFDPEFVSIHAIL
jgi:hypothetical protein